MNEINYNLQFDRLCDYLKLGHLLSEPVPVSGGLLHKMFAINTTSGKYAVKALNPQIMLRPPAMKAYINSEKISNLVAEKIPALPAKIINGRSIQEIENQYYLVFDWVDGTSLKITQICAEHSRLMGEILADIHNIDFSELNIANDVSEVGQEIDWSFYLQKGQEVNAEWVEILNESSDSLYYWNTRANLSGRLLADKLVISHRDLDPKNVLWKSDKPVLIDWEAAGYVNPMYDLVDTAVYWSEAEDGSIDNDRFLAFVKGYKSRSGEVRADWRSVLEKGYEGKLGWLEYNLKRSLGMECTDIEEQRLGTEQVFGTMSALKNYSALIPELDKLLSYRTF